MALTKLTDYEKELCIEVLSKRLKTVEKNFQIRSVEEEKPNDRFLTLTYKILSILKSNFINLTPTHKAYISGCLMEHVIDHSEVIRSSYEFDFLLKHKKNCYQSYYLKYDTAASLRNRFSPDKRTERKHRIIEPICSKVEKVLNSKIIYFSMSDDKIYKIAVFDAVTKQYWKIETSSKNAYNQIQFSSIHKSYISSYSGYGTPLEVLELIKKYEQNNELEWGCIRLKQLIEKMVEYNQELVSVA